MIFETLEYGITYLLPCYCIRSSFELDMQHDHIPKKLNFVPQLYPYVHPGIQTKGVKLKSHQYVSYLLFLYLLHGWIDSVKILTIDLVIEKFK